MMFSTLILIFSYSLLPLTQAADYVVRIGAIGVVVTASPRKDSLVGGIAVTGSSGVTNQTISKILGDQGGDHPITFYPDQLEVRFSAGSDDHIQIVFTVVNNATTDQIGKCSSTVIYLSVVERC
jgi:hypothetical protein